MTGARRRRARKTATVAKAILLMAAVPVSHAENLTIHAIALFLNMLLYGLLGTSDWLLRWRQLRWPLGSALSGLAMTWFTVLSL